LNFEFLILNYFPFLDLQNKKIPNPTIAAPRSRIVLGSGTAIPSSAIAEDSGSVRIIVAIERIFFIAFRHQKNKGSRKKVQGTRNKVKNEGSRNKDQGKRKMPIFNS